MKNNSVKIASSLLILMFIVSGTRKVFSFGSSEGKRLLKKLPFLNISLSTVIVFCAGLWELVASAIVLRGIWNDENKYLQFGSCMLVIFTVLATLIFYCFPFKYLPFLSNLTTTCALFLLPFICVKC